MALTRNIEQGLAMVSPFLPDGNAAAYLASHPDVSTLSLLVGAAYGLEYLHTRQPSITHGDLRGVRSPLSPLPFSHHSLGEYSCISERRSMFGRLWSLKDYGGRFR
jgi:hypothetical protein